MTDTARVILWGSDIGALMHFDSNTAGAYAYEQALQSIKRLGLPMRDNEQQFRRAYFNVLARNQNGHVKNVAFLMDRKGIWRSPAFDVTYSYNPSGNWTSQHQMSFAGCRPLRPGPALLPQIATALRTDSAPVSSSE